MTIYYHNVFNSPFMFTRFFIIYSIFKILVKYCPLMKMNCHVGIYEPDKEPDKRRRSTNMNKI